MLLGLHTYSLHHHGIGGANWGGQGTSWPQTMDIFNLMDETVSLGLDGLHIMACDCESTEHNHLQKIRSAARERGLYLEYNFSLANQWDPRINHTIEEGIEIARKIGSDVGKISIDLARPRPLCTSRHHPDVMHQMEGIAQLIYKAIPRLEETGIKLAIENHTDTFASEVIWLIDQVDHPLVGACVDTANAMAVTEDPMVAIETLAPRSFTNHFDDHRIELEPYGFRYTGVALGDGDIDLKKAYEIIRDQSPMNRINIEVELDAKTEEPMQARRLEREAVEKSIRYCREVLGI